MDLATGLGVTLGIVFGGLGYVIVIGFILWVLYGVIQAAVRSAMDDHYRKRQWFEATGLWYSGRPPKGLPGAGLLTKRERKDLPKEERPEF